MFRKEGAHTVKKEEFIKLGVDEELAAKLKTAQNYDGSADINSATTETHSQGFVTASRMNGWTEKSFSTAITSDVKFMDAHVFDISKETGDASQCRSKTCSEGLFVGEF